MEDSHLLQRDIETLKRAQSISANPSFYVVFASVVFFLVLGVMTLIASLMDVNEHGQFSGIAMSGVIMVVLLIITNVIDYGTSFGDKVALIAVSCAAFVLGALTLGVELTSHSWFGLGSLILIGSVALASRFTHIVGDVVMLFFAVLAGVNGIVTLLAAFTSFGGH